MTKLAKRHVRACLAPFVALLLLLLATGAAFGQAMENIEPIPIDNAAKGRVIDSVFSAINETYVFPDVAAKMEKHVRSKFKKGEYEDFEDVDAFCRALTQDLQDISHDRHLHVDLMPPRDVEDFSNSSMSDEERERIEQEYLERSQRNNFGWREVSIMPGNVGYVKLNGFSDAAMGGPTAIAAMNFLAYTDAVIFDLTENGGGSPSMIQLISSYFFEEPTHLNSFYIRSSDSIQQFWTSSFVEGPRMSDVDVYIVTSGYTFSAAEEFTYNFKNLKRGTIVGETTGGGAHPVDHVIFPGYNVQMAVPYGRAINPITGTNWEGTGVTPDIEAPRVQAVDRAYHEALSKLKDKTDDERRAFQLEWAIEGLDAKLYPATVSSEKLAGYTGQYEDRKISYQDGKLIYQRGERPPMVMIPMSDSLFRFDEIDYFRLEVVTDMTGSPTKLIGHYDRGNTDESERTGDV